jgi:hypothetical protein
MFPIMFCTELGFGPQPCLRIAEVQASVSLEKAEQALGASAPGSGLRRVDDRGHDPEAVARSCARRGRADPRTVVVYLHASFSTKDITSRSAVPLLRRHDRRRFKVVCIATFGNAANIPTLIESGICDEGQGLMANMLRAGTAF